MKIFTSETIGTLSIKNRIVMAPMCMYASDDKGFVNLFHQTHYPTRAFGGVGLIIQEATAVTRNGRITERDLGIWSDDHIPGLKTLVDKVHEAGALMGIQLGHAGRKCGAKGEEVIVAPSAIAYSDQYLTPKALTIEEIQTLVQSFKQAAIRADRAGYDLIELHGAHGYLINQFISPLTNHREDAYGGTLEKRARFLVEVVKAVREVWNKPLTVRISAVEFASGGHEINDTLQVLALIRDKIDGVNISAGGVVSVRPNVFKGYQIPYAEAIKNAGYKVIGGGFIREPEFIEEILQENKVDFVFLGRELLLNPFFVLQIAKKHAPEHMHKSYERGF